MIGTPPTKKSYSIKIDEEKEVILEAGHISRQSDGAVILKCLGTLIHASVVSSKTPSSNVDFLPLTVEYREKFSASGKIPGGFFKKEMQPNDTEILISRLIDRSIRPLFPDNYFFDTQVIVSLFSYDERAYPDVLTGIAVSAAIAISDIPFNGPVATVRVAKINDAFVLNPPKSLFEQCSLNFVVSGTKDSIVMVEGEAKECSEEELISALSFAHEHIKKICSGIEEFAQLFPNAEVSREIPVVDIPDVILNCCREKILKGTLEVCRLNIPQKKERRKSLQKIVDDTIAELKNEFAQVWKEEYTLEIKKVIKEIQREAMRHYVFTENKRVDGRTADQIREIYAEIDVLKGPHGSALFTRGETQVLASVVLGYPAEDMQIVDEVTESGKKKFLLHYNFPPYSVGEIKPLRGPSRREIGHSYLALKGIKAVLPPEKSCPFVIRIAADVLESNGSSSMATVCATSLALMDCGIPIKSHVAGIAMGLLFDYATQKYIVLTDILGDEDHLGDMDFKLCGTRQGITACQMDIKLKYLPTQAIRDAIKKAREAHFKILDIMDTVIAKSREQPKSHAPKILTFKIPKDLIGVIIGPSGKVIKAISEATSTSIYITPDDDAGIVEIYGSDFTAMEQAKKMIQNMIFTPKVGEVYTGIVKSITPYGAFVEIAPGKIGLLHISEIDYKYIASISDIIKEGDVIEVKVIEVEEQTGRFKLSRKALIPKPEKQQ